MTDYLVVENTGLKVVGIGAASGLVVAGQTVHPVADGVTVNRKQILQGATVTLTNGEVSAVTYPSAFSATEANNALRATRAQFLTWEGDMIKFGSDVWRTGTTYLNSGWQALKYALADSTISDANMVKICRNAAIGALNITSVEQFASSLYSARANPAPTRAQIWADANGRRALNDMVDHGAFVEERPFSLPTSWRS